MKGRILLFVIIFSSLFFTLAHAQEQPIKNPDVPIAIRMYPGIVTIYMAGGGQPGVKVTQGTGWNHYDVISSESTLVIKWETNASDLWQIEVYVNYTAVMDQTIRITYYGVDMLGNALGSEPSFHVVASNVWVHLSIMTLPFPRPPTLREQLAYMFVENNPIAQAIAGNTAAIDDLKGLFFIMVLLYAIDLVLRVGKRILGFFGRVIGIR